MSTHTRRVRFLTPVLLAIALVCTAIGVFAAVPPPGDSQKISTLLGDAKTEAVQLNHDAEQMQSFTRSKLSWNSYAAKLNQIKEHVNKCGDLVQQLNDAKSEGSPWQQQAIERITPLLTELASNTTTTIEHLNNNQNQVHMKPFQDYVVANYDLASELSALITDFVNYGQTKDKFESLGQRLEVAER